MKKAENKDEQTDHSKEDPYVLGLGDPVGEVGDTDIGTIFVNREYRIKRFVSTVTELINLNPFNIDHALEDFSSRLVYDQFKEDINNVLENHEKVKKEVADKSGRWYVMELRPYVTTNEVEGVIITFVDVTDLKKTEEELANKVDQIKDLQRQIIKNDVKERWKIGQYLHDELAQSLLSAKFMASHLKGKLKSEENGNAKEMDQLLDILDRSIEGARDLSHEIVPIDVEEEGVVHAFKNLAKEVEKLHGIQCRLDFDNTVERVENIEMATHLYRVAHEAAKNAAVHGESDNITITLKSDDSYLYLNIEDDGKGFSDTDKVKGGMGINIMRHRMELIGGKLEVKDSADPNNNGAVISCRVPIGKMKE